MASWFLRRTKANVSAVAQRLQVSNEFAAILLNRGIRSEEEALSFLHPNASLLHDALQMHDMQKAVHKIKDDIDKGKKITIYGDYDVDGVMSTVILCRTLRSLGANVDYYVPHRQKEGYGLNIEAVQYLSEKQTHTILACDNGIAAIEEVYAANEKGIDVVILDHHEAGEKLPNAYAIVDPKKKDCPYPFKMLCAGAISFKFAQLLCQCMDVEFDYEQNMIFAGIATVCDIVDLVDENRMIVHYALHMMAQQQNIGLKALMDLLTIDASKITTFHIGFMIGPCINATGRLESAEDSVELFLCDEPAKAKLLAGKLHDLNVSRKNYTQNAVRRVLEGIENTNIKNDKVYVVYDEEIHESLAGIVAGRVKETYYHPTIILTKSEGFAKGSARSIPSYNIFEELSACKHLFLRFGGHPMAAGLSLDYDNVDALRHLLNENCSLSDSDFIPKISIDCVLSPDKANFTLYNELSRLEPYGKANEKPIFAVTNAPVRRIDILGSNANTLKFHIFVNQTVVYAIAFNAYQLLAQKVGERFESDEAEKILKGVNVNLQMDFCYTIGINSYRGTEQIQIIVEDFRFSGS